MIRESTPDELLRPPAQLALEHQHPTAGLPPLSLSQLFDPDACGRRVQTVVLYGTVGTGKSTLVRKMVLDWCYGRLPAFELLVPFSCEDLSSLGSAPASLCQLVAQRYTSLKEILPLMAAAGSRLLFVLHGLERLNLDFRLAGTGLCSNPEKPEAPAAIIVNLLRKYMLPEVSILTAHPVAAAPDLSPKDFGVRSPRVYWCGSTGSPSVQTCPATSRLCVFEQVPNFPELVSFPPGAVPIRLDPGVPAGAQS